MARPLRDTRAGDGRGGADGAAGLGLRQLSPAGVKRREASRGDVRAQAARLPVPLARARTTEEAAHMDGGDTAAMAMPPASV